jgi:hypothetical protein
VVRDRVNFVEDARESGGMAKRLRAIEAEFKDDSTISHGLCSRWSHTYRNAAQ